MVELDHEACYRAVSGRDPRFDGVFYTAVTTTGIYCRPSCPARTPAPGNVTFHPSAAAAQEAGFRACKRCLPDATPGSPSWDVVGDVSGRAMRLIEDGIVDREGVPGLARRLGYTPRHLTRLLTRSLGAGPLALARAHRVRTARVLIETTDLGFADIAFASGFSSVRQFNDTVREVYASSPSELRGHGGTRQAVTGRLQLRIGVRSPFDGGAWLAFMARRAVPGVELIRDGSYSRTLELPHGHGLVQLVPPRASRAGETTFGSATFDLADLRDIPAAVQRVRLLLDADCDPVAVAAGLGSDPLLGPILARHPGLRVPGQVDGFEVAVRAIVGQQVSLAGAKTLLGRLTRDIGRSQPGEDGLTRRFPEPEDVAGLHPESLPMPRARARALVAVAAATAAGELHLDRSRDREQVISNLLAIPGVGPWTAGYIALRALGHPDVFLETDVGVRNALRTAGQDPRRAGSLAARWAPWRSYALMSLWQALTDEEN